MVTIFHSIFSLLRPFLKEKGKAERILQISSKNVFIEGHLPSNVLFHQRLCSLNGFVSSVPSIKVVFFCLCYIKCTIECSIMFLYHFLLLSKFLNKLIVAYGQMEKGTYRGDELPLGQKLFNKCCLECPISRPLFKPHQQFWNLPVGILSFVSGVALKTPSAAQLG